MIDFKKFIKRVVSGCLAVIIAASVTVGGTTATALTYNPSAALAYAAAHWNDGKGECAEFVRDCLIAGGLTDLTSKSTIGLMNQIVSKGYGSKHKLTKSGDYYLMSENSAILSPGDPIIFYCDYCGFYPHIVLAGEGSGGYVTYYAHNNAANNKKLWANVGGSHTSHNNYAYAIHMAGNGYYPVDEYVYATYTVSNEEGSDLRNRPYKEYGYDNTSVEKVAFGDELTIVGFYENENGVTYAHTENGYWIYATDIEKKEDLESLSISGETKPTTVTAGKSFSLKGTVTSKSSNITALTAGVYKPDGTAVTEKTVNPASATASMSLVDAYIAFGKLSVGSYIYKVTAKNALNETTLVDQAFSVVSDSSFTVSFNADGGKCDTLSLDVESGKTAASLPTPTKEGFVFGGWFDENGNEFTTSTAVTASITVTAKWTSSPSDNPTEPSEDELAWEIEKYIYAEYSGGGITVRNVPYEKYLNTSTAAGTLDGTVTVIAETTNYYGEKWLKTEDGNWVKNAEAAKVRDLVPFSLSSDVNYPEKYHIAYTSCKLVGTITSLNTDITEVNGGIYDTSGKRVYGTTVSPNAKTFSISKIDDYIAFRSLGVGEYYYRVTVTNSCGTYDVINYEFKAVTEVPKFVTVTFDANEGECDISSLETELGKKLAILPVPTREGYDFIGWFDENGNKLTAATVISSDMSFTAEWEVKQPELDELRWELKGSLYAKYKGKRASVHNVPYTLYHDYETEIATLNGEVTVIGYTVNFYGEKWYLTDEGDWIMDSDKFVKTEDLLPFTLSADTNYPPKMHLSYTSCKLYGTVISLIGDIKTVNGGIFDLSGNRIYGATIEVNSQTFDISEIDDSIAFRRLGAGEYYYRVIAENDCGTYDVINYAFTVVDEYPEEVTLTFKTDSLSSGAGKLTVARGDTIASLPTPKLSGYIFDGWVDEDGNSLTTDTKITYNMTVTPVWIRRVGDVNFDDVADAADLILLEQYMLGIADGGEMPDVNGDGAVDISDAVIVQMTLLGIK